MRNQKILTIVALIASFVFLGISTIHWFNGNLTLFCTAMFFNIGFFAVTLKHGNVFGTKFLQVCKILHSSSLFIMGMVFLSRIVNPGYTHKIILILVFVIALSVLLGSRNKEVRKNKKGFSLLECMVAMLILSIGILGMAKLQYVTITGNSYSKQATIATTLVQGKMEDLKNQSLTSLVSGNDSVVQNGVTFQRTWTVTGSGSTRTITVTVRFGDKAKTATTLKGGM